jgi:hypothetical protein
MKYGFIHSIEEEEGEPLAINRENYYYRANWSDLTAEKQKQNIKDGDDVRAAGYVLDELGIPNIRCYADDSQEDADGEPIGWVIYWA